MQPRVLSSKVIVASAAAVLACGILIGVLLTARWPSKATANPEREEMIAELQEAFFAPDTPDWLWVLRGEQDLMLAPICERFVRVMTMAQMFHAPASQLTWKDIGIGERMAYERYQSLSEDAAKDLLAIFKLPPKARSFAAPCLDKESKLQLTDGSLIMKAMTHVLKLAGLRPDDVIQKGDATLHEIIRAGLRVEVQELKRSSVAITSSGDAWSALNDVVCTAMAEWGFTPRELGLTPEEDLNISCPPESVLHPSGRST